MLPWKSLIPSRRRLKREMSDKTVETVKVIVRCRPLSQKELTESHTNIISTNSKESSISLANPQNKQEIKSFTFDATFGVEATQAEVYQKTAYPIVEAVLNGYNGTIFAYGILTCFNSRN